uniref:Predicted protein n=1 Tax=Hordeum vulgare subsp. vulgare TaxID=112509 RepID=F2DTL6_HORVV|nr:predicted protein [Hordeum vulgare subsp. vulgare]
MTPLMAWNKVSLSCHSLVRVNLVPVDGV